MMQQEKVTVLWNEKIGPLYFRIGLSCNAGYSGAKPGQFVMIHFQDQMGPFLRRPFSIHKLISKNDGTRGIELLCKVVGEGTKKLSMCQKGDVLDILGPLGTGFSFTDHYRRIFIVAGGIGVAPMPFLASFLQAKGVETSGCTVFLGGRSKDDLLCEEDFLQLGMKTHMTTDDGSQGDQCLVTHPVEIAAEKKRPDIIYACGPWDMLTCVIHIAEKLNIPCQVSIETMMACGMGACLGCAVASHDEPVRYMHACVDGPVFESNILKI
ncbi:MAG: dihydroorotate dehydrogenase electron transfer subunit [Desulfobacterales bacterium]|nr:MAG: dihydroorotate dehydrogenase electron transfer subunit [Desulfobacterales bacterium]